MDEPKNLYEFIGCIYSIYKRNYFTYDELLVKIPGYTKQMHMKLISRDYFEKSNEYTTDKNTKNKWRKYKLTMKALNTNKRWNEWKMFY